MMRILVDTDILLDVALDRPEHIEASAGVLRWVEEGGDAAIAWHSIANCAYILKDDGRVFLEQLLMLVDVASVGTREARAAMALPMRDLEDALQSISAQSWDADYIITRNLSDFRKSPVRALSPTKFLRLIDSD